MSTTNWIIGGLIAVGVGYGIYKAVSPPPTESVPTMGEGTVGGRRTHKRKSHHKKTKRHH